MSTEIAIVGAGICGMCTGLALSKKGHQVTLYERDAPPPGDADQAFFDWDRRGAAQFRHPHAFLGLMCNLLEDNYPDLLQDFYAAGARRVNFVDMLSTSLAEQYEPQPGDEKLWMLLCRRATMETVLRRYVERMPNVEIVSECNIEGVIADRNPGAPIRVRGFTISKDGEQSEVLANIVIDASGRTSRFPHWFKELGAEVIEEKDDSEIVYYTRHYRLLPGVEEPKRNPDNPSNGDLGYLKFGVFPGDNGHFSVILCLPVGEEALKKAIRDGDTFDEICHGIPGLVPWVDPSKVEATTDSFGIGDIHAVWRHYVKDGEPIAVNFFAVGDAALRTNPLYGRGCSTGILHAHLLSNLLDEVSDPKQRAIAFDALTESELRPIFKASLSADKRGIRRALAAMQGELVDTADSFKKWLGLAFADALEAAAREQLTVTRGAMRTFNLLEKPGAFLGDWKIRLIVLRYMLRGRKRNMKAKRRPGPTREEMLRSLENHLPAA